MVESLMLSLVSGALGIWLSRFGVQFVAEAFGRNIPYWMHFPVDGRVVAILVGLCIACTLAFGLGPALVVSRTDAGGVMKEGGRTGIAPRVRRWTQALLIAELAVTVILLAGAGLMVRSFLAVYRADQVIDPAKVLTMEIALPERGRPDTGRAIDVLSTARRSTGRECRSCCGKSRQHAPLHWRPKPAGVVSGPPDGGSWESANGRGHRSRSPLLRGTASSLAAGTITSTLSTAHQVIRQLWSISGSWNCFTRTTIPWDG